MSRRISTVRSMSQDLDYFGLQETHASPERALALETEFKQHCFFWSHCSLQKGGLALAVSHNFLARFAHVAWIEIEQGKVGKLELMGVTRSSGSILCVS